jgi:hypothetical protein
MGTMGPASPFRVDIEQPVGDYATQCRALWLDRMNQPFASGAELLAVPANFLRVTAAAPPRPWVFPEPDQLGSGPDVRLLDAFTVAEMPESPSGPDARLKPWDPENGPRRLAGLPLAPQSPAQPGLAAPSVNPMPMSDTYRFQPFSFGKINLNTASPRVMGVLPGFDAGLLERTIAARELSSATQDQRLAAPLESPRWGPFQSLSDFATRKSIWIGHSDAQRLASLLALCPLVTVQSTAFRIFSVNVPDPAGPGHRPSQMACYALVQISGRGADVLEWGFHKGAPPPASAPAEKDKNGTLEPGAGETSAAPSAGDKARGGPKSAAPGRGPQRFQGTAGKAGD